MNMAFYKGQMGMVDEIFFQVRWIAKISGNENMFSKNPTVMFGI